MKYGFLTVSPVPEGEIAAHAQRKLPQAAARRGLAQPTTRPRWRRAASCNFKYTPSDGIETGSKCVPASRDNVAGSSADKICIAIQHHPSAGFHRLVILHPIDYQHNCRYALGEPELRAQMTPFNSCAGGTTHARSSGLSTNANEVNEFRPVRGVPDYLLCAFGVCRCSTRRFRARAISGVGGNCGQRRSPRRKIDLWLGADAAGEDRRVAQAESAHAGADLDQRRRERRPAGGLLPEDINGHVSKSGPALTG